MQAPEPIVALATGPSAGAEAFRALRTHVMAQHIDLGRRALAVCAAAADVGCTSVAVNLAAALSQIGLKTLLVDANLRSPDVGRYFPGHDGEPGLAQCLADGSDMISDYIAHEVSPDLSVMFAGGVTARGQELLATSRFDSLMGDCLRDYDVTILDTPPSNLCADALRVSSVVGYSIIVVRRDETRVQDLRILAAQLEGDGAKVIGTVMTEA